MLLLLCNVYTISLLFFYERTADDPVCGNASWNLLTEEYQAPDLTNKLQLMLERWLGKLCVSVWICLCGLKEITIVMKR